MLIHVLIMQVAERALFLWNNEHLVDLMSYNREVIFPIIMESLEKNLCGHWNTAIPGLTTNVRKLFEEMDEELYEEIQKQVQEKVAKIEETREQRELRWKKLEEQAN